MNTTTTTTNNTGVTNLVQLTDTTFTVVNDNKTYSLSFIRKEKALEFQIKRQLSPATFEGIFTLEDFLKIDKLFVLFDDLKDVYEVILRKIKEKNIGFFEYDNFLNFILNLEVESKKKIVFLRIPKNPEFDVFKHIEDLSNTVLELMEKEKYLSNTVLQLMEKVKKLEEPPIFYNDSSILRENEFAMINEWIEDDVELKLLYKSSIHGNEAENFHFCCDNNGPTISFIENGLGRRFGGYTTLNWDSSGNWKSNDPYAFIFSLDQKRHYKITDQNHVIRCNPGYSVTFGAGHDIYISSTFPQSYSNFPYSYGKDEKFENKPHWYLTGAENFSVKDVEVYSVIKKQKYVINSNLQF